MRDRIYSLSLGEPDSVNLPCAIPFRDSEMAWIGNDLVVQLPGRDVLDAAQLQRLASGASLAIAVRMYAFHRPPDQPMSLAARTCELTWDSWNKVYVMSAFGGKITNKTVGLALKQSMRVCFSKISVMDHAALGKTPTILGVIVDVDPSPDLLSDVNDVVKSGYGPVPAKPRLAGTFASLFCRPSNALRFRTQLVEP